MAAINFRTPVSLALGSGRQVGQILADIDGDHEDALVALLAARVNSRPPGCTTSTNATARS
jgi:hypothetical protein